MDTTALAWMKPKTLLAYRAIRAEARADAAEARALELEAALDALTTAVGTCKMSTYVDAGMLSRLTNTYNGGGTPSVRAPHDQDPRVQSALTDARALLGRAL